ncbi:MAG: tRNA (adenosine(37)-N6)-threonylcarbamoyltransferase complex transferase subunit TsaD [Planctomycetota bacterium]|jgi:N6-L-threonylcarbamoyladenine synthase
MTTLLAIESSCDETSVAIVRNGTDVLSSMVASQAELHSQFGGVVPEVACRAHMEVLLPALEQCFNDASITPDDLSAIAVTNRPGLIGALLIGVSAAKALAYAWGKPLIGVNHIEGHIAAAHLAEPDLKPPFIALVVSGGHTNLFLVEKGWQYRRLGGTCDDAAGEAFDKAAAVLDLSYPGGPSIEKAARQGDSTAFPWKQACLPRKKEGGQPYPLSFSGIKTAVLYAARSQKAGRKGPLLLDEQGVADAAASFQAAVVHALTTRALEAARDHGCRWIAVGGGVSANSVLRTTLEDRAKAEGLKTAIPPFHLCTDNAIMIAARAHEQFLAGDIDALDLEASARAIPNGER